MRLVTVGHGTLPQEGFVDLVHEAGIAEIVDVRSFPGSRRHPQFGRQEMQVWLPRDGVDYLWLRSLGGRRKPVPDSPNVSLRHPSFRAYADYMQSREFVDGIDELLARGDARAVMCAESVWWRCHRRLIADYLQLIRNVEVQHLMHDGRLQPHHPTDGVRVEGTELIYDASAPVDDAR